MNSNIIITKHGQKRAKERLGLNKSAISRNARRALENGLAREDLDGKLKRYVDATWEQYRSANNLRLYHRVLYVFDNNILITMFFVPRKFFGHSDSIEKRQRCAGAVA